MAPYKKSENVVTRSVAGERVLVPIRAQAADLDSIFTLNDVGAQIWDLIDGVRTPEQIAEAITDVFEVDPEHALNDVQVFLDRLEASELIA